MKYTPDQLYEKWWKQCGERQLREVDTLKFQAVQDHQCRVIEQEEFVKTIKNVIREAQAECLN